MDEHGHELFDGSEINLSHGSQWCRKCMHLIVNALGRRTERGNSSCQPRPLSLRVSDE